MFCSFEVSFQTSDGNKHRDVVIDLELRRRTATTKVFLDETRTIALVPTQPLRFEVRSSSYETDPVPVADMVIAACLSDLEGGLFVATRCDSGHRYRWTQAAFDRPKVARWAGWTTKIKRLALVHAAQISANSLTA